MPQATWRTTIEGIGAQLSKEVSVSGGLSIDLSEEIAGEVTDSEVVLGIDFSALQFIALESDQDLTLETNSGSAPDDTISLKANNPLIWEADASYFANPLTADVTSLFVTNAGSTAANLRILALVDPTP